MQQASELLLQQLSESNNHVDKELHWLQQHHITRGHKRPHLVVPSSLLQDGPFADGPYTPVQLPFLDEEVASDMSDWVMTSTSAAIIGMSILVYAGCATCMAMMFFRFKRHPPRLREAQPPPLEDGSWKHGLLNCCDDPALCAFATCCGCILWADTIRMANFFYPPRYCQAFILFMTMVLGAVCAVFAIIMGYVFSPVVLFLVLMPCVFVIFRQLIRRMFSIDFCTCSSLSEDCCAYCCCSVCAMVQESRQLDAAHQGGHPAIRIQVNSPQQHLTPMSSVASPMLSMASPQGATGSPMQTGSPVPPTSPQPNGSPTQTS